MDKKYNKYQIISLNKNYRTILFSNKEEYMSSLENGIVKPIAVIKVNKTNNGRPINPRPRVPAWFKEFKAEFDAFVAAQMQINAKQQELWAKQMQFNAKQEQFNAYVLDVFKRNNLK